MKFHWESEFKDTEIGKIPKDWKLPELSTEFQIIMGQSPPSKYYNKCGKGIIFVQGNKEFKEIYVKPEIYTSKCHKIAPENSVLITVRAPVGNVNLTQERICIGRGVAAIFHKKKKIIKNKFCYYILLTLKDYISSYGEGGTTYDSITKKVLEDLLIPFPAPDEQTRIATVLGWFDDLIENKKRQNEILEKTAKTIFKSWFVDFEPFRDSKFVYNEELDREIPEGWEVKKLQELGNVIRGVSFKQDESSFKYFSNSIPVLRANNIKDDKSINFSDLMFIPINKVSKEKELKEKDLIMVGSNGNPALVGKFSIYVQNIHFSKCSFGSFMYCIRMKKEFSYIISILNSKYFKEFLSTVVSGTNIINLKKSDLEEFKFLFPPQPILQKFHSLVEPLFQKIILNQKEIMVLRKIRDALLLQLVFGKLRVVEL